MAKYYKVLTCIKNQDTLKEQSSLHYLMHAWQDCANNSNVIQCIYTKYNHLLPRRICFAATGDRKQAIL